MPGKKYTGIYQRNKKMTSKGENPVLKVDCYSGYKADEKPLKFILGDNKYKVDKIIRQWRSPEYNYFEVQADDGKVYLLKNDNIKGSWLLEKVL